MHTRRYILTLLITLLAVTFTSTFTTAASIKDRMAGRIPAINTLKDQGLIGENNTGYLEYRSGSTPSQDVVNGENTDRQAVYTAIAQKQGVSAQLVGQRRAKMIAENGKAGHWFQAPDGSWYTK